MQGRSDSSHHFLLHFISMSGAEQLTWGAAELSHQPCSLFLFFYLSHPCLHFFLLCLAKSFSFEFPFCMQQRRRAYTTSDNLQNSDIIAEFIHTALRRCLMRQRILRNREREDANSSQLQLRIGARTPHSHILQHDDFQGEGRTGRKKETFDCLTGCRGLAAQ